MKRKVLIIAGISTVIGLIVGGITLANGNASTDDPVTIQGVNAVNDHQQGQLDNHDARITNTESDVNALQTSTNTQPSSQKVTVPAVPSAPSSTQPSSPEPAPITVIAVHRVPVNNSEDVDCRFDYSDGSTHSWRWQSVTYNQGTKITNHSGVCDNSMLGRQK